MSAESTIRRQLKARAWDALAMVEGDLAGPVEEAVTSEDGRYEAVLVIRPKAPAIPPPSTVISLAPLQRFLPGAFLSDLERVILAVLLACSCRRTFAELRSDIQARLPQAISESVFKITLARMTDPEVGILDNERRARPPGYQVTGAYRAFLDWAAQAQRLRSGAA